VAENAIILHENATAHSADTGKNVFWVVMESLIIFLTSVHMIMI